MPVDPDGRAWLPRGTACRQPVRPRRIRPMVRRLRQAALPLHRHSLPQLVLDGALVAVSYYLAYRVRFDTRLPDRYHDLFVATVGPAVIGTLLVLTLFRVYAKRWRYTQQRDYLALIQGVVVATVLLTGYVAIAHPVTVASKGGEVAVTIPTGVVFAFFLVTLFSVGGVRFATRAFYERGLHGFRARRDARTVLIVGAGDGGQLVLREIMRNPELRMNPVGFVDDDPTKLGSRISGVKVLGNTDKDFPRVLEDIEPDEVMIAIPSAPGTVRARVVGACRAKGIPVRTLPTVFELLQTGGGAVRQVREVQVEDVLGREPVLVDVDRVGKYLAGEVVMVTGAGGSIGSELCRQIARVGPRRLILLDHAEDNLFRIQRELLDDRHVHPDVVVAVLADCKEDERMREIFRDCHPTIVFHAAAYKHVGLMELNPVEAVNNNALGTRRMCRLAGENQVKRFVLVSTDKAVTAATVMGASKALAEMAVEAAAQQWPGTTFSCVRFGNVLGSSGSVVPIFRQQIARGGPVTVTDERMQRYFMTIPEAVQLVIRSGSLTDASGAIYVLDMGEPVKIIDLARAMIELSGLDPDKDIAIEITGRRPGEKLDEELFNPFERVIPTPAQKINRADRDQLDPETVKEMFDQINLLVLNGDAAGLAAKVAELSAVRATPDIPPSA